MNDFTSTKTVKGERGYELDMHFTFARPLPHGQAIAIAAQFEGLQAELYAPHDDPTGLVPSLRLTGPWTDAGVLQALLTPLLGLVRVIEVGRRGFLRSATGQMEWMPWQRNSILSAEELPGIHLKEGIHYIVEVTHNIQKQ